MNKEDIEKELENIKCKIRLLKGRRDALYKRICRKKAKELELKHEVIKKNCAINRSKIQKEKEVERIKENYSHIDIFIYFNAEHSKFDPNYAQEKSPEIRRKISNIIGENWNGQPIKWELFIFCSPEKKELIYIETGENQASDMLVTLNKKIDASLRENYFKKHSAVHRIKTLFKSRRNNHE